MLAEKPIDGLSKGMKQRLCLGRALVHDPAVMVLDEPAAGLDPRARIELREMIRAWPPSGKTILISSHILTELAAICDVVGILERGRLLAVGTVEEIQRQGRQPQNCVEVRLLDAPPAGRVARRPAGRRGCRRAGGEPSSSSMPATRRPRPPCSGHRRGRFPRGGLRRHSGRRWKTSSCKLPRGWCNKRTCSAAAGRRAGRCHSTPAGLAGAAPGVAAPHHGEWLNPILVKECRQATQKPAVRRHVFTAAHLRLVLVDRRHHDHRPQCLLQLHRSGDVLRLLPGAGVSVGGDCSLSAHFVRWPANAKTARLNWFPSPRCTAQIVAGKLGSTVVQMIVYFSALSPCLAFTYLLHGIDVPTIAFILAYAFLRSLALSATTIAAVDPGPRKALANRARRGADHRAAVCLHPQLRDGAVDPQRRLFAARSAGVLDRSRGRADGLCQLPGVVRSRHGRAIDLCQRQPLDAAAHVTMLAKFLLFAGWMAEFGVFVNRQGSTDVLAGFVVVFVAMSSLHWSAMGSLLVLEQPNLSPRVKRRLPQTFLGRVLPTWFNPGPGTGYLFAVSGQLAAAAIGLGVFAWLNSLGRAPWVSPIGEDFFAFTVIGSGYVVFYLGLGKLFVGWLRRFVPIGFIPGLTAQLLLLSLGTGIPAVIYGMSASRGDGYSLLQLTKPFWTLSETLDRRGAGLTNDLDTVIYLVPAMAVVVFLFNLPGVAREVRHVRIAAPPRVVADEAAPPA